MKERYNKPAVFVASQLSSSIIALYKKKVDKKTIHRITKKISMKIYYYSRCVCLLYPITTLQTIKT